MTSEIMIALLSFGAGCFLGLLFYGGLYWTVSKSVMLVGQNGKISAIWFPGSQMLRTCGAITGFYLVSSGDWKRLMLCFMGFIVGRVIVSRYTKRPRKYLSAKLRVDNAS